MKFVNIPITILHKLYRPGRSDAMDSTEDILITMICARFTNPQVLEIGTQYGHTTANIARVVKPLGGEVVTVDVMTSPHTLPEFQVGDVRPEDEIGREVPDELKSVVTQVLIDPNDLNSLSTTLDGFDGRKWDFVFIDGDHSYKGVKHDYISVMQRLSDRGLILFHDVWWDVEPPPVDGPLKLMEELGGSVLNMTHLGCLPDHLCKLRGGMICQC